MTETLGAAPGSVTAGIAADNVIVALYFLFIFSLAPPGGVKLSPQGSSGGEKTETSDRPDVQDQAAYSLPIIAGALTAASALCLGGATIASLLPFQITLIPITTLLTLAFATARPQLSARLAPAGAALGTFCMQLFFGTTGAAGRIGPVIERAPSLFFFSAVQIAVHFLFITGTGFLFSIPLRSLLLASNANVGGPSTAAGMATAKRWNDLKVQALLVGIAGYACGTFLALPLFPFLCSICSCQIQP